MFIEFCSMYFDLKNKLKLIIIIILVIFYWSVVTGTKLLFEVFFFFFFLTPLGDSARILHYVVLC